MSKKRDEYRHQWRENGKKFSRNFKSKAEKERFKLELKLGIVGSESVTKQNPLMTDFFDRYLNEYSKTQKGANTYDEDKRVIERHLKPYFGSKRLQHLKKSDLVEFKAKQLVTKAYQKQTFLKPKTVNNHLLVAKSVMSYAVELELIPSNPWINVEQCEVPEGETNFWSFEERDLFYEKAYALKPDHADLALLACMTGLRRGEFAGLIWSQVNFENRSIHVTRSYSVRLKKDGLPPKGKKKLPVPLNPVAFAILKRRFENRTGATVFPTSMFPNLRRDFRVLCKRIGVRDIRFHDTRHTFGSALAKTSVDSRRQQELLRVTSEKMVRRYAHLNLQDLDGSTDALCSAPQMSRMDESRSAVFLVNDVSKQDFSDKWRTLSDSNARPSGSKPVVTENHSLPIVV